MIFPENANAQEGSEAGAGGRHRRRHLCQEGEAPRAAKYVVHTRFESILFIWRCANEEPF